MSASVLKRVTVANLSDQIGTKGPRAVLYCPTCHEQYSANSGDYWNLDKGYVFKHCRRNMRLGFPVLTFVEPTR